MPAMMASADDWLSEMNKMPAKTAMNGRKNLPNLDLTAGSSGNRKTTACSRDLAIWRAKSSKRAWPTSKSRMFCSTYKK